MSNEGTVCLLMILNINTHANVTLEHSLRGMKVVLVLMKQIWAQINGVSSRAPLGLPSGAP